MAIQLSATRRRASTRRAAGCAGRGDRADGVEFITGGFGVLANAVVAHHAVITQGRSVSASARRA
jgi:hypothetical protein